MKGLPFSNTFDFALIDLLLFSNKKHFVLKAGVLDS